MSDMVSEQISRLLDDDLPDEELDLLLKQLDRSPEHMKKAVRYQVVSNSINSPTHFTYSSSILERVRSQIDAEPDQQQADYDPNLQVVNGGAEKNWGHPSSAETFAPKVKAGFLNRRVKPIIGAAIAASVAVITVITYTGTVDTEFSNTSQNMIAQVQPATLTQQPKLIPNPNAGSVSTAGIRAVNSGATSVKQPAFVLDSQQWDRLPQNMRENVNSYISQHNNYQMVSGNGSKRIIIIEENSGR